MNRLCVDARHISGFDLESGVCPAALQELAAADELDYFVAVAGNYERLRPLRAGQNFHVALDSYAARV